ncbi:MAG: hypothetical protein AAB551_03015 [Patescibacteria group bacterium]
MTSQISFTADNSLKQKVLEKTKREGLTLKAVLLYSMKAYLENQIRFGILHDQEVDVEEVFFDDKKIHSKARKLAKLLK